MKSLDYEELVLLNNLIYLEWDAYEGEKLVDVIDRILQGSNLEILMNKMSNCIGTMTEAEWINILNLILNDSNMEKVTVCNIENDSSGMRAACFIYDNDTVYVIFRGTTTLKEWEDNGQGAYEYDTIQQIYALNYINKLDYKNIIVSGHSKGGNKAQYVTVRCPKINKCISINGQGFSNEFIKKYDNEIHDNKEKIVAINSKYDYVNCLFNTIAGEIHYFKTDFQKNPLYYHKANILIDKDGHLKDETKRSIFSKIINDFTTSLICDLPKELKLLTTDGIISGIEGLLCGEDTSDKLLQILGSVFILLTYGRYFQMKETIALGYSALQMVVIPLLLWGDFVTVEETHSPEKLQELIEKIDEKYTSIMKKLKINEGKNNSLSVKLSKTFGNFISKLKSESYTIGNS
ncbi:MAG: DUF2974 domain-containing protein, partial [Clostridium sp.]|nr:DUF2974 domain-containing protein [Clostridium sp.]